MRTVSAVTKADRRNKTSRDLVFLMEDDWGEGATCITDSIITWHLFLRCSLATRAVIRLERQRHQKAAGTVQAHLSIMYGTPAYLCAHTLTCSLTHTAITPSLLPGYRVCRHHTRQNGREMGSDGAKCQNANRKKDVITVLGSRSKGTMITALCTDSVKLDVCTEMWEAVSWDIMKG